MAATIIPPKDRDGFEIAIICALKLERDAVEELMEVDFKEEGRTYGRASQDRNAYTVLRGGASVCEGARERGCARVCEGVASVRGSAELLTAREFAVC